MEWLDVCWICFAGKLCIPQYTCIQKMQDQATRTRRQPADRFLSSPGDLQFYGCDNKQEWLIRERGQRGHKHDLCM